MKTPHLSFATIDLTRNADVAFRRDSYVCSFGSDEAFGNAHEYLAWLQERILKQPAGQVHVWNGPEIMVHLMELELEAL